MTTRHEFLQQLHELIKPTVYLEIGVHLGWSLQLSNAEVSIGVDPEPMMANPGRNHIFKMTSDEFFKNEASANLLEWPIDLAFIDGKHWAEFAWRDFVNIAKYCHEKSVIVFDDVLPTTQEMAAREMCPGSWTGDVWKVWPILREYTGLVSVLVDTEPTGTLVVTGFDQEERWKEELTRWSNPSHAEHFFSLHTFPVPDEILDRRHAWSAPAVLENLKDRGFGK